jgi:hypothetical protein
MAGDTKSGPTAPPPRSELPASVSWNLGGTLAGGPPQRAPERADPTAIASFVVGLAGVICLVVGLALVSWAPLGAACLLGLFAIVLGVVAPTIPSPPAPPGAALAAMAGGGWPGSEGAPEQTPSGRRPLAIAGIILGAFALLVPVAIGAYLIFTAPPPSD